MVGIPPAVLERRRLVALALLAVALAAYFGWHASLPRLSTWWDVAVISLLVMPAVFALALVFLPLWSWPLDWAAGLAFVVLAVLFSVAGWDAPASFAKLGAATFFAWAFLELFEDLSWVVLVAFVIPFVDAYSVWRGPTNKIVNHHESIFERLSFGYPVPGSHGTSRLGIPDMLFFALFLAACARWGLRIVATWALMVASFGATIAIAVGWNRNGLPALPLLSLAFLVANADLLVARFRRARARNAPPSA